MGLVDKATEAAKRAVGVAQKGAEKARLKGQEMKLNRRRKALAEELGHVVVRQQDGEAGLDGEVQRLTQEIQAVKAEIAGLGD